MSKQKQNTGILIVSQNKKAWHDFQIIDTYEAGIVLKGSEVKSIRAGEANLKDSYVRFLKEELYLVGCHINPYSHSPVEAHLPTADRKLLLHKKELEKLYVATKQKGLTIIPLKAYFKGGKCKLEIATAKGKKIHDKREDLKKREIDKQLKRVMSVHKRG